MNLISSLLLVHYLHKQVCLSVVSQSQYFGFMRITSYKALHNYTDAAVVLLNAQSLVFLSAGQRLALAYISSGCYRVHQSLACDCVWYLHGEYSMEEGISAFIPFTFLNGGLLYTTCRYV